MHSPRYLVSSPRRRGPPVPDVLVVGAGIAGLRPPSPCRRPVGPGRHQGPHHRENIAYAQGGIAGVLSPEDRFENHVEDTLAAGAGLCDRDIVELVVREAPQQIDDLIRWGTHFDEEDGQLALTREGGHSHRRIVHALGDATGHEVMRAIIASAPARRRTSPSGTTRSPRPADARGRCVGGLVVAAGPGRLLVWAKQIILASGGAGMVYRETTNPPVATGDGMAAAWRAGPSCGHGVHAVPSDRALRRRVGAGS